MAPVAEAIFGSAWHWLGQEEQPLEQDMESCLEQRQRGEHANEDLPSGNRMIRTAVTRNRVQSARCLLGWTMTVLGTALMAGGAAAILVNF